MIVTTSSSVITCNQETKASQDKEKIQLITALPKTELGFIHVEAAEELGHSLINRNSLQDIELGPMINISRHIVNSLIKLNDGGAETGINPFELYVTYPTLINNFGDMRAIVEVYDYSKTHEGQIEVTFTIDLDIRFLVQETNLGTFSSHDEDKFEITSGIPTIKDKFLFKRFIELNPALKNLRFKDKIKRVDYGWDWDEVGGIGRVELFIENYQNSVIVTYRALKSIYDVIQVTNMPDYSLNRKDATQENMDSIFKTFVVLYNAEWLLGGMIPMEKIHVSYFHGLDIGVVWIDDVIGHILVNMKIILFD